MTRDCGELRKKHFSDTVYIFDIGRAAPDVSTVSLAAAPDAFGNFTVFGSCTESGRKIYVNTNTHYNRVCQLRGASPYTAACVCKTRALHHVCTRAREILHSDER